MHEYFGKPSGFFEWHLDQHSKSRRQTPIYWPLSTDSGSYTIWLYYHRLTDQTLYSCVNECLDHPQNGKIRQVREVLQGLRQKSGGSRGGRKSELERLSNLELELSGFRDELLRIARIWKPNLNDGVLITAAPLWNLFRLTRWRRKLKDTWDNWSLAIWIGPTLHFRFGLTEFARSVRPIDPWRSRMI